MRLRNWFLKICWKIFFFGFTESIINEINCDSDNEKNQEETDKINLLMCSGTQREEKKKSSLDSNMGKKKCRKIFFFFILV